MLQKFVDESCKKPAPLYSTPAGKECPVCGKRSYSLRGIHPQCAVVQADAPRQAALAAAKRELAQTQAPRRAK
ncbi:hypothetical protein [Lacipirellula parvula]|jgi:hypothetical protein|nr:hypothetical protein [Lacipirellula parvula]